jgi:hypothetical protein
VRGDEPVTEHFVSRQLELAFLAPDIVAAILEGRQPADFTLDRALKTKRPLSWADQRASWGFPRS